MGKGVCQVCILSPCLFNIYVEYIIEMAMAPNSSILAWKIPWTEEPGRLQSMGSLRVRQDWATSLSFFTFMHWRRKWQPTHFLAWRISGMEEPGGCHLWFTQGRTRLKQLSSSSSSSSTVHHEKCHVGRSTSWNQDFQEKYQ